MAIKDILNQIRQSDRDIKLKQIEIEELNALIVSVGELKKVKVQTSTSNDHADIIVKLIDKKIELEESIKALNIVKQQVAAFISALPDQTERTLLLMRYFQSQTWCDIALTLSFTVRNILYIHGRALKNLEKYAA